MKQKLLAMMFALFAVQTTVWAQASGYCGDPNVNGGKDVTWTFVDGTLTISGTGAMADYSNRSTSPWSKWSVQNVEVEIQDGVTSIGDYAFLECAYITNVTISNSVTSIGDNAFSGCTGLTDIVIPNSVTTIENYAFYLCDGITDIIIPSSVTSIGVNPFIIPTLSSIVVDEANEVYDSRGGCNAIIEKATNTLIAGCKNTVVPNTVTCIGEESFFFCVGLTDITIPSSVTTIGECAFSRSGGLTNVVIPNSVTSIGNGAFEYCSGLTDIAIPSSVTSIGNGTFQYCTRLTNVAIPSSVATIGEYAFQGCSGLTDITIPNSVTSIGRSAFASCSSLADVTCLNPVPPTLERSAFNRISDDATLHVPDVAAYQEDAEWPKYFSNIEQIELDAIHNLNIEVDNAPAIIYDLSGRRVTNPVKGQIYIVNGKAVVM